MIEKIKSRQNLEASEAQSDRDWLEGNLSSLDEDEPYDWGDADPLTLGNPVRYLPIQNALGKNLLSIIKK